MGEETDNVITTQSKLRSTIMKATRVSSNAFKGFDILTETGQFKSTYEILQGISDIWEEIGKRDEVTGNLNQNLLLETMAGKNRSNILASILQSPDVLRDVYNQAQDSAGSAEEELSKYLDSIQGRTTKLTNSVQELTTTVIDSDVIKIVVSGLTATVKGLTDVTRLLPMTGVLLGTLAGGSLSKLGAGLFKLQRDENGTHFSSPFLQLFTNRHYVANDNQKTFIQDWNNMISGNIQVTPDEFYSRRVNAGITQQDDALLQYVRNLKISVKSFQLDA